MERNTIKAFTLVEMLIVIVIIGILIASLMPRMQSAQGRARDVARKNDLSQIQTAIITSQQDKGKWPLLPSDATNTLARAGMAIGKNNGATTDNEIKLVQALQDAGMSQVPTDPNGSNQVSGLGSTDGKVRLLEGGKYGYMVTKRNSVADGGFVLMAKTEVEGSSNWVVCPTVATTAGDQTCDAAKKSTDDEIMANCGLFKAGADLKNVKTCTSFEKNHATNKCQIKDGTCYYTDDSQLAYILVY